MLSDYLWDCEDSSGQRVTLNMRARSIEESKDLLLKQGYRDLKLQSDDTSAASSASFGDKVTPVRQIFTPEQRVEMMRNSRISLIKFK